MASILMISCIAFLFFMMIQIANCVEFEVCGDNGWVAPKSKDDNQMFNQWASNHRFNINDTLRFKYKKDSVMEVTKEEYDKCSSPHPHFFSNNGDSIFKFDKPGLFYFISGVAGHCDRGLKMIVKVLELVNPPPSHNQTDSPPASSATKMEAGLVLMFPALLLLSI